MSADRIRAPQAAEEVAVIEERERLARELHDSIVQSLYSMTLFAAAGRERAEIGDLEHVSEYLDDIGSGAHQALKEMRLLVYELRPPVLEEEGLVGALRRRLDAVEGRAGLSARLLTKGLVALPRPVEEGLYRIAQEALNNTLKHTTATTVTVYLRGEEGQVELEVVDDGCGFDPEVVGAGGGMGLMSMRERAEELGGTLTVSSAPGEGTSVQVRISLEPGEKESPSLTSRQEVLTRKVS